MKNIVIVAGLAACTATAQAQFLTGITKPVFGVNPPNAFLTDLNAGTNTLLYDIESLGIPATAPGWGGLAGDDANSRFFASVRNGPTDDIYQFNYSDPTAPIFVTRTRNAAGGNFAIDGLAFDSRRGVMYASNALGTSGNAEGLHTIDLTTGVLTTVVDFATLPGGISGYNVTGIDYDADTDLVYLVDEQLAGGRWIYTYDPTNPTGGLTELVQLPDGVTDVDGLGAGGGQLFLVTDNAAANGGNHYIYDLALGTFSTFASPYPAPAGAPIAPNPSGAGAYVPGLIPAPGTLLVLAGMTPFMRRRR